MTRFTVLLMRNGMLSRIYLNAVDMAAAAERAVSYLPGAKVQKVWKTA